LQYGTTEGDPSLRKMLVERHNRQGLNLSIENLIIVTGSQQAIDLIAKVFLNPDDYVICGLPSYLGGINAFTVYGAKLKGIPLDEQGMIVEELEDTLITLRELGRKVKLLYLIPDFQNPAGITLPNSRREKIIQLAKKYDILIIEDSPYREVRFEGEPQKLMQELDPSGRVITLCSFSKILAPGFRVGWVIGHPAILDKLVMAKQTADICTSTFVQKVIARYMEKGLLEQNLKKTIDLYRERRTFMLQCFKKYMPEAVRWTEPQGGLFLFVTLPQTINANDIFNKAIERNVAFVTGSTFFCNDTGRNTMRINFSYSNPDEIDTGVKRLAEVICEELASK
jgi:2-aminoadipate transaminase